MRPTPSPARPSSRPRPFASRDSRRRSRPEMTVPARISIVTLGVEDVGRSAAFYEALGWERASSSMDEIAWFRTADSWLGIFGRGDLAADANLPSDASRHAFGGITLAINVETAEAVDAALAEAVAA